eukprot:CAMPEP_0168721028 /NCGR_PEP_ID=MMETSP0724-20121128/1873_1 /TAXON_ID=265536 /ORGANISM="Amphiprora sp., Strain CCMP467" /LENGTH=567 /DNA_ID=CAMNT_0008767661 /DNA_START=41 /DNA_END=1744 /DNA_ORIENTATION=-
MAGVSDKGVTHPFIELLEHWMNSQTTFCHIVNEETDFLKSATSVELGLGMRQSFAIVQRCERASMGRVLRRRQPTASKNERSPLVSFATRRRRLYELLERQCNLSTQFCEYWNVSLSGDRDHSKKGGNDKATQQWPRVLTLAAIRSKTQDMLQLLSDVACLLVPEDTTLIEGRASGLDQAKKQVGTMGHSFSATAISERRLLFLTESTQAAREASAYLRSCQTIPQSLTGEPTATKSAATERKQNMYSLLDRLEGMQLAVMAILESESEPDDFTLGNENEGGGDNSTFALPVKRPDQNCSQKEAAFRWWNRVVDLTSEWDAVVDQVDLQMFASSRNRDGKDSKETKEVIEIQEDGKSVLEYTSTGDSGYKPDQKDKTHHEDTSKTLVFLTREKAESEEKQQVTKDRKQGHGPSAFLQPQEQQLFYELELRLGVMMATSGDEEEIATVLEPRRVTRRKRQTRKQCDSKTTMDPEPGGVQSNGSSSRGEMARVGNSNQINFDKNDDGNQGFTANARHIVANKVEGIDSTRVENSTPKDKAQDEFLFQGELIASLRGNMDNNTTEQFGDF